MGKLSNANLVATGMRHIAQFFAATGDYETAMELTQTPQGQKVIKYPAKPAPAPVASGNANMLPRDGETQAGYSATTVAGADNSTV